MGHVGMVSRSRVVPRVIRSIAILACMVCASAGYAQPGDHIRVGDAQITPTFTVGGEYHTNIYLAEIDPTSAFGIKINPDIAIGLDGANVKMKLGAGLTSQVYFGFPNLNRWADPDISFDLDLFPKALIGLKLGESFGIQTRVSDSDTTEDAYIKRTFNDIEGMVSVHPGAALNIDLGGGWTYWNINPVGGDSLDEEIISYSYLNERHAYGPRLEAKWAFFPRTAIIVDGTFEVFDWIHNLTEVSLAAGGDSSEADTNEYGCYTAIPDGYDWKFNAGLAGKVTDKVTMNMILGYGQAVYNENSVGEYLSSKNVNLDETCSTENETDASATGFDQDLTSFSQGLLANINMRMAPTDRQVITIAYKKDFKDSYFSNYVAYNYFYGSFQQKIGNKLAFTAEGGFRLENIVGEVNRKDDVIRLMGKGTYDVAPWMSTTLWVSWDERASADRNHPEIEYDDITVFGSLDFVY